MRLLIGLTALLWVVLLANSIGRTNFRLQAPALNPWADGKASLSGPVEGPSEDGAPLPSAMTLLAEHPNDPNLLVGLSGSGEFMMDAILAKPAGQSGYDFPPSPQENHLYAEMTRYPRNPALLAIRLKHDCAQLVMGRNDNPFTDPDYPKPYAGPKDREDFTSPVREWSNFLVLAQRGGSLEPNNTFFDWMKMAALFALRRDAEAFKVLDQDAAKTGFNDHEQDQVQNLVRVYSEVRPLSPWEQICLSTSPTNWAYGQYEYLTDCITGQVVSYRNQGQHARAVKTAYDLMKLTALMKYQSSGTYGMWVGIRLENMAFKRVGYAPKSARLSNLSAADARFANLATYALSVGRPDIARFAKAERANILRWIAVPIPLRQERPCQHPAFLAGVQERWGRLLLATLPASLVLWFLSAFWTRRAGALGELAGTPFRKGAVAGFLFVALLASTDAAIGWHSYNVDLGVVWAVTVSQLIWITPGLVAGFIGWAFILMSLVNARKWQQQDAEGIPWKVAVKASLPPQTRLPELNLRPLMGLIVRGTMWMLAIGYFAWLCWADVDNSNDYSAFLYQYNGPIFLLFGTGVLLTAILRWWRLPNRRGALTVAALTLRQLTAGYLLAALLIYPVTALLAIPVDLRFDREYQAYLQVGEAATIRQELGL